jgi:hypothetical protein
MRSLGVPARLHLLPSWSETAAAFAVWNKSLAAFIRMQTRVPADAFLPVLNSENTRSLRNHLLEDRAGRVCVGLEKGLAVIADGKATAIPIGRGTASDSVIAESTGAVGASTSHGDLYSLKDG